VSISRDPSDSPSATAQVRSVMRALSIIDTLAAERRSLSVSDVVRLTGLTHSTVHRLLATIMEFGWVEQSRYTSRYRLAAGILGTASVSLAHAPLLVHAKPIMAELAARFGLGCYVGVLVGSRVAYLARSSDVHPDFHPGISQPSHCTSSGKVLLAFLGSTIFNQQLDLLNSLRPYTKNTITGRDAFLQEIARVRSQGYAIDDREFREDVISIAVPIRGVTGSVVAALSCGGRPSSVTPDTVRAMSGTLLELAEQLSHNIGSSED